MPSVSNGNLRGIVDEEEATSARLHLILHLVICRVRQCLRAVAERENQRNKESERESESARGDGGGGEMEVGLENVWAVRREREGKRDRQTGTHRVLTCCA